MKIKKVTIDNIKSFKDKTTIELLDDYNILIGPNGSGKSNLMDILCIIIRQYFLKRYQIQENNYGNDLIRQIILSSDNQSDNLLKEQLEPYTGNEHRPSSIEIEFIVKEQDINNMKEIKTHSDKLKKTLEQMYGFQDQHTYLLHFFDEKIAKWQPEIKNLDCTFTYKIENKELLNVNEESFASMFMEYLNCFELMVLLAKDTSTEIKLISPYLYMGPNRLGGQSEMAVCLSTNKPNELLYKYISSTSKNLTPLIGLSIAYFATKHRRYEDITKECSINWEQDNDVKSVTKYMKLLGYTWDMRILDRNKNIYEIELNNNERKFSLSQASSGEQEIFNFLFGIHAFQTRDGIVMIDEPELHLHPRWQKLLLTLFQELSQITGNQFVIITHAAAFVNDQSYDHILRIYKKGNEGSKHVFYQSMQGITMSQIQRLVNATNNEQIFFADLVILVEGITDRLIFRKIVDDILMEHPEDNKVVEIVELKGKNNQSAFRKFLDNLSISNSLITDLDFVNEIDKTGKVKNMLKPNKKKISENVIMNQVSYDGQHLFDALEKAIETKKLDELNSIWDYIKKRRSKLRDDLTVDEHDILKNFLAEQVKKQIYILDKGDIEKYFDEKFQRKGMDKVLEQLDESNYKIWQETENYKELKLIASKILGY